LGPAKLKLPGAVTRNFLAGYEHYRQVVAGRRAPVKHWTPAFAGLTTFYELVSHGFSRKNGYGLKFFIIL